MTLPAIFNLYITSDLSLKKTPSLNTIYGPCIYTQVSRKTVGVPFRTYLQAIKRNVSDTEK